MLSPQPGVARGSARARGIPAPLHRARWPFRARALACLVACSLALAGGVWAAATEEAAIPTDRSIVVLLRDLRAGEPGEAVRAQVLALTPRLNQLGAMFGVDLRARFEAGLAKRSRSGLTRAAVLLTLLEARASVASIGRDELVGWQNAKVSAAKGFKTYQLVSPEARAWYPAIHARIVNTYVDLFDDLGKSDLTTAPAQIERTRHDLLALLKQLAGQVAVADSAAAGGASP
jgi:hypothetical protein